MKTSFMPDRDRRQVRSSGHFMGSWGSPMALGLATLASPLIELSALSLLCSRRWISDTFLHADCDTCLLVSAERHGRMKFPIKSAAEKNVSGSRADGVVV